MESVSNNTPAPGSHFVIPIMVSLFGTLSTALTVWLYYFFITRNCMGDEEEQEIELEPVMPCIKAFDGVDVKVLECIPILAYSNKQQGLFRLDQNECAVCLGELDEGVMVRLLPSCRHVFHLQCIDEWFLSHSNCPLCRAPIMVSVEAEEDHAKYVAWPNQEKIQPRMAGILHPSKSLRLPTLQGKTTSLKRSLSMDHPCVVRVADNQGLQSQSSSSKQAELCRSSSYKRRSFRRLDQHSSKFMKSISRLCSSSSERVTPGELLLPR